MPLPYMFYNFQERTHGTLSDEANHILQNKRICIFEKWHNLISKDLSFFNMGPARTVLTPIQNVSAIQSESRPASSFMRLCPALSVLFLISA